MHSLTTTRWGTSYQWRWIHMAFMYRWSRCTVYLSGRRSTWPPSRSSTDRRRRATTRKSFCRASSNTGRVCAIPTSPPLPTGSRLALNSTAGRVSQHTHTRTHTHTHTHTPVSRYQKGKTNLDFTEARDSEWQWHQLGHMQVCTSIQTDNHARIPLLSSWFQVRCPAPVLLTSCQSCPWIGMTHGLGWVGLGPL